MNLHKFIQRICAATVASALTLSLCTPVLAEGIAALPAPTSGTSQPDDRSAELLGTRPVAVELKL